MMLTRGTVTAASRVMLPLYPLLYLSVGVAFVIQDADRTSAAEFGTAKDLVSIPVWGVAFLVIAAVELVALLTRRRALYIIGLIPGAGVAGFWSVVLFASAYASPFVSYTSGMWVAGMAVAQAASARSLARYETTT